VGCVAIGRNEGVRLERCLKSILGRVRQVVYVDSGSSDGSVELARRLGALVVELDMSRPFTAARARNAGYRHLREHFPDIDFVQFVDGDCAIAPEWLETAARHLVEHPALAVVCGRRREQHPEASVFNELCDIEWDSAPAGPARACGGDSMMRAAAFDQVGGFDGTLIAGEEPELCIRLRQKGWLVERLAAEMTLHDAAMYRFSQWWRRCVRAGHAYAEGARMHGGPPERHYVPHLRRALFWGGALPAAVVLGFVPTFGMSSLLATGYVVSAVRSYGAVRRRGRPFRSAAAYGVFATLGKFAELQGIVRYERGRLSGRRSKIIEYKR
jgi:glycosyltransferase involved in cell wall biosynthesis